MKKFYYLMLTLLFLITGFTVVNAQDADFYNFTVTSGTYTPVTGTGLTFSSADDASTTITLPFSFNYCGTSYTTLLVSTNGMVRFGTPESRFNAMASTTYTNVIAPFWDDLSSSSVSGHISYYTEGTAPNRTLTIQYSDVYRLSAATYLLNFQIKLNETTNVIEFVYGSGFTSYVYSSATSSIGINSSRNNSTYYISITPTGSGTATTSTTVANDAINDIVSHNLTSGTTYTFTPPAAFCGRLSNIRYSNLTNSSVDIQWTVGGSETQWELEYKLNTDTAWTSQGTVNTPFYSLTGLSAGLTYNVRVKPICDDGVEGMWLFNTFTTLCDALLSMPYSESFDTDSTGVGSFPSCWLKYYSGSVSTYPYISTTNFSAPGSLYMYATSPYYTMAIGPQIDASIPVNILECRFKSYITSTSYNLQVGVMSDVTDPTTFTLIKTILPTTLSVWENQTVYFSNYTGSGQFIAFKSGYGSATNVAYIDNLTIDYAPPCSEPLHLNISNVGGTSAFATWDAGTIGTPSQYIIEYSEAGMNNWTTQYTTDEYYFLSGLSQTTAYDVRLHSVCGMGAISDTIYNTFTTECSEGGTTQVGEGTTTNYYIPVNNYYRYTYSQQIYLPSEVGSAGNIEGIAYQYAYTSPTTLKNNVNIYFGHTSRSSFSSTSDYVPLSSLQLVYSGDLNCSQGWNTFTFDSVFQYNGIDNLVVAVDDNSNDYNGSSYTFYVHQPGSYKSLYFYDDTNNPDPANPSASYSSYSSGNRSNTRFIVPCTTSSCPRPNLVISGYTAFDANLLWAPGGSETSWELEFKAASDTDWTSLGTLTTTSHFLSGLNSNTEYNIRLRAICSGSDQSTWEMETFRTECSSILTLPYTENFDSYGTTSYTSYPNCWYRLTNYSSQYPYVSGSYASNTPGALYFYATTSYYSYAISPEIDASIPISNLMVTLKALISSTTTTYGRFDVGVMTDPADYSTFTVVQSFRFTDFPSTVTWYEFEVLMNSYTGTGQYIAIRSPNEATSYVYIDDVVIDNIPTCLRPDRVRVTNLTGSSADLVWHSRGTESVWEIAYGTAGFDLSTATPEAVYDTLYAMTGLLPNTAYQVYVRSNCGTEYSNWTAVYTFITPCAAVTTLPYYESFDSYGSGTFPDCWIKTTANGNYPNITTTNYSPPGSLYFVSNLTTIATTPEFVANINTLQVSFMLRREGTSSGTFSVGVLTDPHDPSTFQTIRTIDTTVYTFLPYIVDLTGYTGSGHYIGFKQQATSSVWYYWLDDVVIEEIPPCPIPSNLAADTCTGSSVTLSWTERGVATGWEIEYGPAGFIHGSGTTVTATSNPVTISGLNPNSTYEFYIKADCGTGEFSPWSSPLSLFTFQEFSGTTHFEPFEAYNVGDRLAAAANAMGRAYWTTWDQVPDTLDDAIITTEQVNEGTKALKTVDGNDNVFLFPTLTNGTHIFEFDMYIGTGSSGYFNALQTFAGASSTFGFQAYFNTNGTATVDGDGTSAATFSYPQGAWFHPALVVDLDNDRAYFYLNGSLKHSYQWSHGTFGTGTRTINALDFFGNTGNIYYLDNFDTTSIYPSCQRPDSIHISNVTANTVDLSWVQHGSAASWNIEYGPVGFARGTGTLIAGATNPQTITGLTSATAYDFYIQADCGGNDLSRWTTVQTFMTTQQLAVVPYICDFEDPLENVNWSYANGSQANKWYIGTAANNTVGGNRSLYISKNYGATNEYHNASLTYAWAFRDIYFSPTTGDYKLKFDWRAQGESASYDYVKVYIGNVANVTAGSSTPPAGVTQIGTIYNLHNTWQSDSINLPSAYANTTKRLYFLWYNNGSGGNNPPGAIDNIAVTINSCATITTIRLAGVTNTTADINWNPGNAESAWDIEYGAAGFAHGTGTFATVTDTFYNIAGLFSNTDYDVYVRANCGNGDVGNWTLFTFTTDCDPIVTIPFIETFENTSSTIGCWRIVNNNGDTDYWMLYSTYPHSGSYSAGIYTDYNAGNNDDYLISPNIVLSGNQFLSYYQRARSTGEPNDYEVLISTTGRNPSDFTTVLFSDTSTLTTYDEVVLDLSAYTGNVYIAFHIPQGGLDGWYLFIDDVTIDTWPTCPSPVNLAVSNITDNSASLAWTSRGTETAWEVQYKLLTDATWTVMQTTSNPCTLTGLIDASRYEVKVRAVCGPADSSYFSPIVNFTTACLPVTTFPIIESFDNSTSIPTCWAQSYVSGSGSLSVASSASYPTSTPYNGTGMIYFNSFSFSSGVQTRLVSPLINSSGVSGMNVSFMWFTSTDYSTYTNEGVKVQYSLDGTNWTDAGSLIQRLASANAWTSQTVSLPTAVDNQSILYIGFLFVSQWGNNCLLDSVYIGAATNPIDTCDNPTNLTVPSATLACDSAIVNWAAGGNETMWTFEYKRISDADYTSVVVTVPTFTMTGLSQLTQYNVRVKALCGTGDESDYATANFTTPQCGVTSYIITASASSGGAISPSGAVSVVAGGNQTFTMTPDDNLHVLSSVTVDGIVGPAQSVYSFNGVNANHTIHATFEPVGINENNLQNSIVIFPNPANDLLNVKLSQQFESVEITNMLGQVLYSNKVTDSFLQINISSYTSGVYFIRLKGDNGIATKKFIKE